MKALSRKTYSALGGESPKMGHLFKPMVEIAHKVRQHSNNKTPALKLVKLISINIVFKLMF